MIDAQESSGKGSSPEAVEYAIAEYRDQLGTALKALTGLARKESELQAITDRLLSIETGNAGGPS